MDCIACLKKENDSFEITARLNSLNLEFSDLFRPGSQARLWLLSSISRNIRAYGLVDVDAWDILTEAYIRAVKAVKNGKRIWNLVSWMKSASVLIIHEHRRKFIRSDTVSTPEMECFVYEDLPSKTDELAMQNLAHQVNLAMRNLNQMDRDLLYWRVIEELSWKKIRQILILRGETPPNDVTLRQRKQRAIKRLKRAFFAAGTMPSNISEDDFKTLVHYFRAINSSEETIK